MFAFDCMISPFNLVSVIFVTCVTFFLQAVLLIIQFYGHLKIHLSLLQMSYFIGQCFSCLFVSFFLNTAYFIVSFLTVPFISSHFVF